MKKIVFLYAAIFSLFITSVTSCTTKDNDDRPSYFDTTQFIDAVDLTLPEGEKVVNVAGNHCYCHIITRPNDSTLNFYYLNTSDIYAGHKHYSTFRKVLVLHEQ